MGLEDIFIRALTVEYENVTSNGTNGTIIVQRCFAKSSLDSAITHIFDFYLHVFIMSIVIGLGTTGNALLIWISARKLAFTTNYFLMLIGIADVAVLLAYILYFTLPSTYEYLGFAEAYFKVFSKTQEYIWFLFVTCKAISTYGVVLMLVDRYAWLSTQRRRSGSLSNITNARLAISLVLALAIMFAFPKMLLFETKLAHDPCRDIYALNIDVEKGLIMNKTFLIAYEATTEFIVLYAFPVLCMLPLLRGIHRWKVTWMRQPEPYARSGQPSEANSTNHLLHEDRRISSPGSRTPSFLDTSSRTASDKLDGDSTSALMVNDVRRPTQPLLYKTRQINENNECHVTQDLTRRLTAIALSFILLESPNHIFQLVILIERFKMNIVNPEPGQTTVFLAELFNAAAVLNYGIKFYLCIFFCNSFKEQCGKMAWCCSRRKKTQPPELQDEINHRPLGSQYTTMTPMPNTVGGDETPPYGHAEDWV